MDQNTDSINPNIESRVNTVCHECLKEQIDAIRIASNETVSRIEIKIDDLTNPERLDLSPLKDRINIWKGAIFVSELEKEDYNKVVPTVANMLLNKHRFVTGWSTKERLKFLRRALITEFSTKAKMYDLYSLENDTDEPTPIMLEIQRDTDRYRTLDQALKEVDK